MIISISGAMGAGKDTLAKVLIDEHGFIKGSFSASLKDAVAAIFGWERALLEGDTKESREWREQVDHWWTDRLDLGVDVSPRWVLQNFATEVMRVHFHQDIWAASAERWLHNNECKNIVFTDTRFLNEFALLKSKKATIVGVYRTIPKWLAQFYHQVDAEIAGTWKDWTGLMNVDLSVQGPQVFAIDAARKALARLKVTLHASEIQYLLWNKYDLVIDNTKNVDLAKAKIRSLV